MKCPLLVPFLSPSCPLPFPVLSPSCPLPVVNKTKAYRLRKKKEMGPEAFKNMGTEKKRAYRAKVKLDALQQLME